MNPIARQSAAGYNFLGLFAGAGGLDLGFELAGFEHTESNEILDYAVKTLSLNRPDWEIAHEDVRAYTPKFRHGLDVLLAGFPCQGFSLGGNREETDERNQLYREVIRIGRLMQPRVIVMENVLNLRTMKHPETGKLFSEQIIDELKAIGYETVHQFFRVSDFGVPQTRRRFIFVAFRGGLNPWFQFPQPSRTTTIRDFLYDLGQDDTITLPNHAPKWGFPSFAHVETHEAIDDHTIALPVRLSRTASDGNPVRDFDSPFPAIDTATVWGWGKGHLTAKRVEKDREAAMFVRNPASKARLWRISAAMIRPFTAREYARLQTFPDDWVFWGNNKRELQLQIGNAVPVKFAFEIATQVRRALQYTDHKLKPEILEGTQLQIF